MLVRIFKKSYWYSPLLLLSVAALLWLDAFFYPESAIETVNETGNALYKMLFPLMTAYPGVSVVCAFLLLLAQVFMVNYVATSKGFIDRYSALPGLMYLLLMSSTSGLIAPHPVLFANFFLIPAVNKMLNAYEGEQAVKEVFNQGLLIAMASLFYLPALAFFLVLVLSVFVYYIVSMRTIIAAILGLIAPFLFLSLYYFMQNGPFLSNYDQEVIIRPLAVFSLDINIYEQVFIVALSFLSFSSIMRLQLVYKATKPIRVRKRITMLLIVLLISVLSFALAVDNIHVHYGMIVIPLSMSLSVFFYDIRHRRLTEILFGLLLLLVLASRFSSYFFPGN